MTDAPADPSPSGGALSDLSAGALVFGSSAAVLVVEIVALRLLAPYLGLTLETSTLVIGVALAAIATGSWWGGRIADRVPPRRLIGPFLLVSGVVVAATPFLVRTSAEVASGSLVVLASGIAILVPAMLLSAVTPAVTKLQLVRLDETGSVVGRLSGIGTVGAVLGTVVTGFVLISRVPVSGIMVGLGLILVVVGLALEARFGLVRRTVVTSLVLVGLGGVGAAVGPGGCDVETAYHCASVEVDPERASGRVLVLDNLRHSYVDLDDPTHLEFDYIQAIGAMVDTGFDAQEPLATYHLGAGGLTIPRYLQVVRPGSTSIVSELDPGVVQVNRERLALETGPDLEVRTEDGRLGIEEIGTTSVDLVVGDAFGGVSVPWHLTTREAVDEIARVLRPEGVYAANLIDHGPLAFARAELATLGAVFEHLALAGPPEDLAREGDGGNLVAYASDSPLDTEALARRLAEGESGWGVLDDPGVRRWIGGADVLTDAFAPVDQLLTPYVTR
ncbi:fused MFS/spermidine synthase [Nocardioides sp.]|uniref:fused MFS/spermidine synthase n=1 Tax=Nocardioides sp. TaxID=35761 RepID=UPI002B27946F|nr:fused MFS/spermidine synthase [Nocardioides sp.]